MGDTPERIDHPEHYGGDTEFEAIKLIEDWGWGYAFCMGSALKYTVCAQSKGQTEDDYRKAIWYLERADGARRDRNPRLMRRLSPSKAVRAHGLDDARAAAVKAIAGDQPAAALRFMRVGLQEYLAECAADPPPDKPADRHCPLCGGCP